VLDRDLWRTVTRDARRLRLLSLFVLPGVLATGCAGLAADRACTAVGGVSGVAVDWEPTGFTERWKGGPDTGPGPLVARLCVRQVCESTTVTGKGDAAAPRTTGVTLAEESGEVTVPVRFTVTSRGDRERLLFDARTEVELRTHRPNGKGCPPTLFRASLTAHPERGLTDGG
jgi:hypothetical protein